MPILARAVTDEDWSSESDEHLMARLQARDKRALDVLFDRYARLVFGIGHRILRDYGEAEELVQEAFLYVFQSAGLFDPAKGRARAWIVQAAYHRALNRREYLANRRFYVGTDSAAPTDALRGDTDLDREIAAKLDRVQLEKAFRELPEKQRRTLSLFFFEGLSLKEISTRTEEPLGNVRHHYYRGLDNLRKSTIVKALRGI
jgi:RNA polymerase sigma-70 factor, ECF subfamily